MIFNHLKILIIDDDCHFPWQAFLVCHSSRQLLILKSQHKEPLIYQVYLALPRETVNGTWRVVTGNR